MEPLAFYCVTDRAHFLGLVALINSLRVLGHEDRVYVLDCGMESWQAAVLRTDQTVTVAPAPRDWHPMLLKTILPLQHPADVMVVVDVDVIFTQRLDPLIDVVRDHGKPMFFPDLWHDRFHESWERLGFGEPVRHDYVASGQFVLPSELGREFLSRWAEGLARLANDPSLAESTADDPPFRFPDMDVLNAMIGTVIPLDSYALADTAAAAYTPFDGVRVVNAQALAVETDDGVPPTLLHHFLAKPWNARVPFNAYSQLFVRLLCGDDVRLKVPRNRVPMRLRSGLGGDVGRAYSTLRLRAGRYGIRGRLKRLLLAPRSAARLRWILPSR